MAGGLAAIFLAAGSGLLLHESPCGSNDSTEPDLKRVEVVTERDGDVTHFFVKNDELAEITMTFEMSLVNLEGTVAFPHTATFPPGKTTQAFSISPSNQTRWEYRYTNYYKMGSHCVRHDDSYRYQLPYARRERFSRDPGLRRQV